MSWILSLAWLLAGVSAEAAIGVPPPNVTPFTRGLIGTNADSASFRSALGFLSTNNTSITNYVGNAASATNLNASELRSGTVPLARLSGITGTEILDGAISNADIANLTISTGKVDTAFYNLISTVAFAATNVVSVGATNVYYGGDVKSTNVLSYLPSSERTNAYSFLGYGGLQLSMTEEAGLTYAQTNNRSGIEWHPYPWDGTPYTPTSTETPAAFIRVTHPTQNASQQSNTVMHIQSRGSVRIEANYGDTSAIGLGYITLGNEDANSRVGVNYSNRAIKDNSESIQANSPGYSLPFFLQGLMRYNSANYSTYPAIQGIAPSLPTGAAPGDGNSYYLGEIAFYSCGPTVDTDRFTYGRQYPNMTIETGRMLTNGWRFKGNMNLEQTDASVDSSTTNVWLDFSIAPAQTVDVWGTNSTSQTNYVMATNVMTTLGNTNIQQRSFRFVAGYSDRYFRWSTNWSVISESGSATLPTVLTSGSVLQLDLTAWGDGETNIVAKFGYNAGGDKSYSIDADAARFFTAASVNTTVQSNAVNYLVRALKFRNLWQKCDVIYPFCCTNATGNAQNLKSSSYTITWGGTVTHNSNGITGNGSTGYGDTGYTNNYAGAWTNAHLIVYSRTTLPTGLAAFAGAYGQGQSNNFTLYRNGSNLQAYGEMANGSTVQIMGVSSDFRGILGVSRCNNLTFPAISYFFGMNRSSTARVTQTAYGNPIMSNYVLAAHNTTGLDSPSDANIAFMSMGVGLTDSEMLQMRSIVNQYQVILGRAVP